MTAYLFDNPAYPIVTDERDIVPALRDPFCRAVTLRDPALSFDNSKVTANPEQEIARMYQPDASGKILKKPGDNIIGDFLDYDFVRARAEETNIFMDHSTIYDFTSRANEYRRIFTKVFAEYSGIKDGVIRSFPLFSPVNGLGRAPYLHVDMNILNFHWSAALATLSLANGEPSEETWKALDYTYPGFTIRSRVRFLAEVRDNPEHDMRENQIGDAIFFKGQKDRNLLDRFARQDVCAHASSHSITQNGQVAFSMAPTIF